MRHTLYTYLLVLLATAAQAQLMTAPNQTMDGKKEGFWQEYDFCDTVMADGSARLLFGPHHQPIHLLAEGGYENGLRQGNWYFYYIVRISQDGKTQDEKGPLRSLKQYRDGDPCGSYFEFYPSGSLRLIGQYEQYPVNKTDTLDTYDPATGRMKNTIIHTHQASRPYGNWCEYPLPGLRLPAFSYPGPFRLR